VVALRPWRASDAGALAAAWADPEIQRWTAVPAARAVDDAARWIDGWDARRERGIALDLVICGAADDSAVLGEVGFVVTTTGAAGLGWWVAAEHRRQGIATRAVTLLAGWCREVAALEPVADVDPANEASARVARTAGLRQS
jgi:RimJ/RimL family protein N-acetyltransferase